MFAKSIFVALAVPALISGAALPQTIPDWDENSSDIVGGVAAAQGDLPFIVSVQLSGSHFCGGSLVNANTVVSAAHCYEGRTGSSWSIRAGSLVSDHSPSNHIPCPMLTVHCRTVALAEPSSVFPPLRSTPTTTMPPRTATWLS
jgi:secreted trypsin-like serine protease